MDFPHAVASADPADELDPDEPRTPGWLPLLGLTLFVLGGIGFAKYGPTQASFPKAEPEVSAAAAAAASAAPEPAAAAAPPANPAGQRPMQPQQGG